MAICDSLNAGRLPKCVFALIAQPSPDVISDASTYSDEDAVYAAKANQVVLHRGDKTIAVIEIASPGNKNGISAFQAFVAKSVEFLNQGINLLVVDLFPPTRRDPQGIYKAIWDHFGDESFELPADKQLTLASYLADETNKTAYVVPVATGDSMPELPVFLDSKVYVRVPREETYEATWKLCPEEFKECVAGVRQI